jgi:hypothetical protein
MRQLASIAALIGLLISGYGPLPVTSCPHAMKAAICHRTVAVRHCDMPMDEETAVQAGDYQSTLNASAVNCPMECCRTVRSRVLTLPVVRTQVVALHVSAPRPDFPLIVVKTNSLWLSPQRGPPSA